jgi:hypothetical protein
MPGGRPSKLTTDRTAVLLEALRDGQTVKASAARAGISYDTLHLWLQKGQQAGKGRFFKLCQDVEGALQFALSTHLARWASQTATDWRAAKEYVRLLAHRADPELFAAMQAGRAPITVAAAGVLSGLDQRDGACEEAALIQRIVELPKEQFAELLRLALGPPPERTQPPGRVPPTVIDMNPEVVSVPSVSTIRRGEPEGPRPPRPE